jgi:hypothetical protein
MRSEFGDCMVNALVATPVVPHDVDVDVDVDVLVQLVRRAGQSGGIAIQHREQSSG